MKDKAISRTVFTAFIVLLSLTMFISMDRTTQSTQGVPPILQDPYVYEDYNTEYDGWNVVFEIIYKDSDNDDGDVILHIDGMEFTMQTDLNIDPADGRYYYIHMIPSTIQDEDAFYFTAEDINGETASYADSENPLYVGDYMGWGEKPVLSEFYVTYLGELRDFRFGISYKDPEADPGYITLHVFKGEAWKDYNMNHKSGDPQNGETFEVSVPEDEIGEDWYFFFEAWDEAGSTTVFPDQSQEALLISSALSSNGGNGGNGGGNGGGGIGLPKGWLDNPEVVVGILGLVAIGAGSAYGVYRRKKKHGRFSELLTELDEIYASFKLNPKRCETELEKIRGTINEELKKSTIDENNYSILKTRIDEILKEIRSESIKTQVAELPKDIEIKIKDMLIDGEITRSEYDKLLPIIKGSSMSSDEKEKVKKMVESYMVEEKKD